MIKRACNLLLAPCGDLVVQVPPNDKVGSVGRTRQEARRVKRGIAEKSILIY